MLNKHLSRVILIMIFLLQYHYASSQTIQNGSNSKIIYGFIIGYIVVSILIALMLLLIIRIFHRKRQIAKDMVLYAETVKKYNAIFKSAPLAVATFAEDGKHLDSNQEFFKIAKNIIPGFKTPDKVNLLQSELVSNRDIDNLKKGNISQRDLKIENETGTFNFKITFVPIVSKKQKSTVVSILDTSYSETERLKRDEDNDIFSKALSKSSLGAAEIDLTNGSCIGTEGWYKGLGIANGLRISIDNCFINLDEKDKDIISAFFEKASKNEVSKISEEIKVKIDNKYRWIKIILQLKEYDSETNKIICSAVLLDINALKQKEEQLKSGYLKLQESNKIINSFIANLSHEIKTPLNAIVGFSELLIESSDVNEQKELLKYLEDNNEKFIKLILDIVDISKIEAGTEKCIMSEIEINEMLGEIAKTTATKVNSEMVKVVFNPHDNGILYSNKERLVKVLNNIVTNAIQHTTEGTIEIGYEILSKKIKLYVKDTGAGISEDKRDLLFNRVAKPNKEYAGLGLGIPIAHSIAKLLGGELGFESEVGEGTTFWCLLPYDNSADHDKIGITGRIDSASMSMGKNLRTMLVAEDNENNFQLLKFILKGKYKIIHAINGEVAVKLYQEHNPDIVLMDIKMPVMDGYQATAEIRKISTTVPIIAVTAYAFNQDKEKILNSSFNAFIEKPIKEKDLIDTIEKNLNK